jgi:hypothetical protein
MSILQQKVSMAYILHNQFFLKKIKYNMDMSTGPHNWEHYSITNIQ